MTGDYVYKDGAYTKKKVYCYHIVIGILLAISIFFGTLFVGSTRKSNDLGRQLDTVREQLAAETETNRRLGAELEDCTGRLEQCSFIIQDLGESTSRDIKTVRDCCEIIEELRYEIACLSYYISGGSADELYNRIDDWLQSEGVEVIK